MRTLISKDTSLARSNNEFAFNCGPLHHAAFNGHLDVCKYLIAEAKADVNAINVTRQTPLFSAVHNGHREFAAYLLSEGKADVSIADLSGTTPIYATAAAGNLDMLKALVENSPDENCINVRNSAGVTPLMIAAQNRRVGCVKYLASIENVDVQAQHHFAQSAFFCAVKGGDVTIVKTLAEKDSVDVNELVMYHSRLISPLHTALTKGHISCVNFLVTLWSIDLNVQDNNGYTVLHLASKMGETDLVRKLLAAATIDFNARTNHGSSALHIACRFGRSDVVNVLVSHIAVSNQPKIYMNALNEARSTPLHFAAKEGHLKVVKILVSCSATNGRAKNKDGKTAMNLAQENNHLKVADVLRSVKTLKKRLRRLVLG